jgi:hypothetical protein
MVHGLADVWGDGNDMSDPVIKDLRRQLAQQQADVKNRLALARTRGDQRAVDFFSGQLHAFRVILDTLDLAEVEEPDARRKS